MFLTHELIHAFILYTHYIHSIILLVIFNMLSRYYAELRSAIGI